jgi:hypothetical protein
MWTRSRDLRDHVVRALAKVGVVWSLAVLAAMFMATAAHGERPDGGYSLTGVTSASTSSLTFRDHPEAPRTAGLALVLALLAGGVLVLTVGSSRGSDETADRYDGLDVTFVDDLPLALGLGFTGTH